MGARALRKNCRGFDRLKLIDLVTYQKTEYALQIQISINILQIVK